VAPDGSLVGAPVLVNTAIIGNQITPEGTSYTTGGSAIVWEGEKLDTDNYVYEDKLLSDDDNLVFRYKRFCSEVADI